ncbi:FecR family protein [Gluconacetobacter sp.]|uniref:FecR family protein n=1 Tax=Gluconacetobacter sp. TaxID=1935994 RepID=UPI0039E9ACD7
MTVHEDVGAFSPDSEWPQDATEWLMLLREEPDDAEIRARFEVWRSASPDHPRDWEEITHTMGVLRRVTPVVEVPVGRQVRRRSVIQRIGLGRGRVGLAAFSLAASVVLLAFLGPDIALRLRADSVTGRQEVRTIVLVDGSQIVLAPQSAIASRFENGRREVRLLKGEALFTVRHDAAHPFTVFARGLTVTDVGTVFDVDAQDAGRVTVAVREGQVSLGGIVSEHSPILLGAGEELSARDGTTETRTVASTEVGTWAQGKLVVHDWSVSAVVARLSPYAPGPIMVYGKTLAAECVTGIYTLTDPQGALRTLADGQNARVVHATPWLTILHR